MEIVGPADPVITNEEIIAKYDSDISAMLKACADPQFDMERQIQINAARQNWMMIKGNHFTAPDIVDSQYGEVTDFVSIFGGDDGNTPGADVRLCPPINKIGGDCWKFVAVMGQNAPKVKAFADDPASVESIDAAHAADVNIRDLWRKNKIDRRWKALPFHQFVTGPAFLRGVWNTDARKYGQTSEPNIEIQTGPDGLPHPVEVGEPLIYANGDAELKIYSIIEVSTPFESEELGDWLHCEVMMSKWALLSRYPGRDGKPGPLDEWRDGDVPDSDMQTSSAVASEARDATANPSGIGRPKKPGYWRFNEHWIDPYLFEAAPSKTFREALKRQFPKGLYVARVGSKTVDLDNVGILENWGVCKVGRGHRINERPIMADAVPITRAMDDLIGMALETVLRAITKTIMDTQLMDRETARKNDATPSEIIFTALPVDGDINKRIAQIPPARLGDQVLPLYDRLGAAMDNNTGIKPELTGGGQAAPTFRQEKQRKDQALMQLAPSADEARYAAEQAAEVLVKLRSKYGTGTVKAQRPGAYGSETDIADMADLKDDGWHAESDDNFPMSNSDRRDSLFSMLKEFPPEVQQSLSILDSINIEETIELLQIPGYESVMAEQKEKTLSDIQALLLEQPLPGQPGPDGKPGPDQPSMPPDSYDNHQIVAHLMAIWLISKTGRKASVSNPNGFKNVVARQSAEMLAAQPPQPPPPPPVKPSVALSLKLEDQPNLIGPVMEASGIHMPQPPVIQPPNSPDMAAPQPVVPDTQANPIAPLPPLKGPQ